MKLVDANIAANKKLQASEDAITNSKKRSTSATKSKLSEDRKAADEAKRLTQEQFDLRESIYYKYADSPYNLDKLNSRYVPQFSQSLNICIHVQKLNVPESTNANYEK